MIATPDFEPYLERLRELSFVRAVSIDPRKPHGEVDALVVVRTPNRSVRLPAELKRSHLTRDLGHRLVHLARSLPGLLVLAPVVGRDLGEEFAQAGVNFIDLAGNCYLRIGEGYVARVQGRRVATSGAEKGLRAPTDERRPSRAKSRGEQRAHDSRR
jgi:hypothetical protein